MSRSEDTRHADGIVAVRLVIDTVNELAVAGMLNAVTTGAVVSPVGGRVMVTLSLMLLDTLPAASFAHAYSVFAPCVAKVWLVGAVALQPPAVAAGFADVSVRRYPSRRRHPLPLGS